MSRLCLSSIVKSESARIERMLKSVLPYISCWAITDTGSTDDTVTKIEKFFADAGVPGRISHCEFIDWSQARNFALADARAMGGFDYILLVDADMELGALDKTWASNLTAPVYGMYQRAGAVVYNNTRLVSVQDKGVYRGCTHEYYDSAMVDTVPPTKAGFLDHADGANRPNKFKRDIKLLKEGLRKEPANARYMYYLAQSFRDAGRPNDAATWYKRRVEAGGWDEEVWSAQQNYAQCLLELKNEAGFIRNMQIAYNLRPSRPETLFDLAKHFREKGENHTSLLYSKPGMDIPPSKDSLFVNDYMQQCGLKDEYAICAFYDPAERENGFKVCNELTLKAGPYGASRDLARTNIYHYMDKLPAFETKLINFQAPEGWTAMNPSVTQHDDKLFVIIRCVNYKMDLMGRYFISDKPMGELNAENPIRTRNFLARLNDDLDIVGAPVEVLPPGNSPAPLFGAVIGFEDMRLFSFRGDLCISACVREMNVEGMCEQVIARIERGDSDNPRYLTDVKRMVRTLRLYEKNWMPIEPYADHNGPLRFLYRLGEVVDHSGQTIAKVDVPYDVGNLSGGSQVICFQGKRLCLVHEARFIPGTQVRYYSHRFVSMDPGFKILKITKPFVFEDKEIEFAAGMCWHPSTSDIVISYGHKDSSARIGKINHKAIERMLWES
jgi:glycosyltransferase involved in cell wall biosynthesis